MPLKSLRCLLIEEVGSPSPTLCIKVSLYLLEGKTVAS